MSRSIRVRTSSALSRLISICSSLTAFTLARSVKRAAASAFTQLCSVCPDIPSDALTSDCRCPLRTSRTASFLNSIVKSERGAYIKIPPHGGIGYHQPWETLFRGRINRPGQGHNVPAHQCLDPMRFGPCSAPIRPFTFSSCPGCSVCPCCAAARPARPGSSFSLGGAALSSCFPNNEERACKQPSKHIATNMAIRASNHRGRNKITKEISAANFRKGGIIDSMLARRCGIPKPTVSKRKPIKILKTVSHSLMPLRVLATAKQTSVWLRRSLSEQ